MTRLIIIVLLLITVILILLSYLSGKIRNFFSIFTSETVKKAKDINNKQEVIYDKDDIIVLKGDAQKKDTE